MSPRKLILTVLALASGACAPKPAMPTHDPAADRAALAAIRDGYAAAFKAGDAAKVASYLSADAADMEPGQPTMIGSAAVAEGLKGMMDMFTNPEIIITSEKVEVSGDLAYDRGTYKTTMTPKAGGAPVVDEGRYVAVSRRQADSTWKIVELIGNSPVPMVPAPPAKK